MNPSRSKQLATVADRFGVLRLSQDHWTVQSFLDNAHKEWYQACFLHQSLPLQPHTSDLMPTWFNSGRPWTNEDAAQCVPPNYRNFAAKEIVAFDGWSGQKHCLVFDSIEGALRMEAAFCLESLFGSKNKHWYEYSPLDLMKQILERSPSSTEILSLLHDV